MKISRQLMGRERRPKVSLKMDRFKAQLLGKLLKVRVVTLPAHDGYILIDHVVAALLILGVDQSSFQCIPDTLMSASTDPRMDSVCAVVARFHTYRQKGDREPRRYIVLLVCRTPLHTRTV
jgi:hypothetical protein